MAKLLCEDSTFDEDELIDLAATALGKDVEDLVAIFEHGQWWIEDSPSGAQWSVCDCSGPAVFCFEQVSRGDDE